MAEEGSSHSDRQQPLSERLDRLEELLRAQAARIQALEAQLQNSPPRHAGPPPDAAHALPQTPDTPLSGVSTPAPNPPPAGDAWPPPHGTSPHLDARTTNPTQSAGPDALTTGQDGPAPAELPGEQTGGAGSAFPRRPDARGRVYAESKAGRAHGGARTTKTTGGRAENTWFDLEEHVGGGWFSWLGVLAIAFGVAFFLKYAFESDWVGPAGRVLLGASAGLGLVAAGERLRARGPRPFAHVLTGGGVLILYLSIYAAFAFYQLIGQPPAFLLMAAVTALAVLLSARHDALPVAVLALVGGFLTPPLLSTNRDNQIALFTYVALLDAGVLALAYFKNWRFLNHLSFAATALAVLGWCLAHYTPQKLWPTVFFLSLFFLLYALLPLAHNVLPRRRMLWFDLCLLAANGTFYFGLAYTLLEGAGRGALLGPFALCVSAFYLLLYYAAHQRHRADRLLIYGLLGAAVTFFTSAIAIQLELQWVTITWAVEACVLTWVGLRAGETAPRRAGLVVLALAAAHWLSHDLRLTPFAGEAFVPLLNARALSCAALVATCACVVRLHRRAGAQVSDEERAGVSTALLVGANALALILLSSDANEYFARRAARLAGADGAGDLPRIEEARQFTFSALWTLYGASLLAVGVARRLKPLRAVGLALLALAMLKVACYDISYHDAPWHAPLLNQTFVAFALLVAALAFAARAYARAGANVGQRERAFVLPTLVVAANLLALLALSAEAGGYFAARINERAAGGAEGLEDLRLARQLSLSVIWTLYGGGMLAYGHLRQNRLLRLFALGLLALTTLKVFLLDLAALERIYRIVSFVILGLILLAVSYLYQKNRQRAAEEQSG